MQTALRSSCNIKLMLLLHFIQIHVFISLCYGGNTEIYWRGTGTYFSEMITDLGLQWCFFSQQRFGLTIHKAALFCHSICCVAIIGRLMHF